MKRFFPILLSFCLFTQVVAQSNVNFRTIDRIEMYYLDELCSFDFNYLKSKETITIGDKEYGNVCTYLLSDTTAANILQMIKAAFFDNSPIIRKNSENVETSQPVIGITCYSKGKKVYSKRICHEIDYLFSSEYLNLIAELKLLNKKCQAAEN
ncbi:MAG: hypothetical protein J6P65_01035 [Bacteroidales bacterium]|nr:hypothetical protein [Bacteroidales bacterium]